MLHSLKRNFVLMCWLKEVFNIKDLSLNFFLTPISYGNDKVFDLLICPLNCKWGSPLGFLCAPAQFSFFFVRLLGRSAPTIPPSLSGILRADKTQNIKPDSSTISSSMHEEALKGMAPEDKQSAERGCGQNSQRWKYVAILLLIWEWCTAQKGELKAVRHYFQPTLL